MSVLKNTVTDFGLTLNVDDLAEEKLGSLPFIFSRTEMLSPAHDTLLHHQNTVMRPLATPLRPRAIGSSPS